MRPLLLLALAACLAPAASAQPARRPAPRPAAGPPTDAEITSYDIGYQNAVRLHRGAPSFTVSRYRAGFEAGLRADSAQIAFTVGLQAGLRFREDTETGLDPQAYLRGIEAGFAGSDPTYTPEVAGRAQAAFGDSLRARQERRRAADPATAAQRAETQRVLTAAAARPGAVVSPTGLVSVVTTPGTGASPTRQNTVAVRYAGRLADGTPFDATPEGQTAEFSLSGVIPGFAEALTAMKVGESRTIWMPPALGYGDRGAGQIPPGAPLEFDLTLVSILR